VRHSIGVTRAARTARIANRLILDVSGQETNTASDGVVDFVHERAKWTDDFSDVPGDRVPAGTPGRDLLLTVREVGRDLFVSLPVALPATQIHTTWVQARTTPLPGTNALTGFGGINPRVPIIARLERPDVALNLLRTARSAR